MLAFLLLFWRRRRSSHSQGRQYTTLNFAELLWSQYYCKPINQFFNYLLHTLYPGLPKSLQVFVISKKNLTSCIYTKYCNPYQALHAWLASTVTNIRNLVILLYYIIAPFIVFYRTFYSIVLWYMYRPRYWAIFSNSVVQLQVCYNKVELSRL